MKHHRLRAVAHNLADSLASGLCFVIGYWEVHVFDEASASPDRTIVVDFLTGRVIAGMPSVSLEGAVAEFRKILPEFCKTNGVHLADFKELTAKYRGGGFFSGYEVTVEDASGKRSTVQYVGNPGKRQLIKDDLGRIRRAPVLVEQVSPRI